MKQLLLVLLIAGNFAIFCSTASAYVGEVRLAQQGGQLSQDEAAAKVRKDTGGRVLDVSSASQDGGTVFLVKVLLPDGRVRVVTVR